MIAVIKCKAFLPNVVKMKDVIPSWSPKLGQDHEMVLRQRQMIINEVSEKERTVVSDTSFAVLYDENSSSWVVVSKISEGVLTFRVHNSISDKLKNACDDLVRRLHEANIKFEFIGKVEIFEPQGDKSIYYGEIFPKHLFRVAIKQKQIETAIGIISLLSGIILLIITIPPITAIIFDTLTAEWKTWVQNLLDQFTASALITATVSSLTIIVHFLEIKKKGIIHWTLE